MKKKRMETLWLERKFKNKIEKEVINMKYPWMKKERKQGKNEGGGCKERNYE